ncbi:MAG: sulfide/dihydroorotate dehydrogenase-like FAD/NAD-binding protein [Actinobacteria bacterium]|nr:sulfide/dihydroorotate dehydrogenase-like FAD/NAD-binding protein [Actinomycetota bacterium]MBU4385716.1 sulfide/dihydroorotate dehydrogenase-like FAD/NAD-binding protein [Actinomycetota bacterium]
MKVTAPLVPPGASAGQFIIVRVDDHGERIPLTLMDFSTEEGTVEMVFQVVGTTTDKLSLLGVGDCLQDVVGPLGMPTEVDQFGRVACVGGGVGIAALYPIARAMVGAGNDVRVLLGSRDREHLVLLDRMEALGAQVEVATDDGSVGTKGFVTSLVKEAAEKWKPDRVVAVGPVPMMAAVSSLTRGYGILTVVSLNAIMLDGTGMCGTCRCEVGGETKFSCVDGPEFDGHQVDFDLLTARLGVYRDEEEQSRKRFDGMAAEYRHPCGEAPPLEGGGLSGRPLPPLEGGRRGRPGPERTAPERRGSIGEDR